MLQFFAMEAVKEFLKHCSSPKTSLRCTDLVNLQQAIRKGEIAENAVKPLVRALGSTLFIYSDSRSVYHVQEVMKELCTAHSEVATAELALTLKNVALTFTHANKPMSRFALTSLTWSIIGLLSTPTSSSVFTSLVESQCIFVAYVHKYKLKAAKLLKHLWKKSEDCVSKTIDVILNSSAPNKLAVPLLSMIGKHCEESIPLLWKDQQVKVINFYNKAVLNSRTKLPHYLVDGNGPLFHQMSHDQFTSHLLSPVTKCMLRSPDELIEAVAVLFDNINLDCSRYAMEIIKVASNLLRSSSEATRDSVCMLVLNLSRHSSDHQECISLCQYLLDMLNGKGSGGKIPLVEHRVSVITAIKEISNSLLTIEGAVKLANVAISGLLAYLKIEAHSGTQVALVKAVCSYCKLYNSVSSPAETITYFKNALEAKTTPPHLRIEYWHCVDELCKGNDNDGTLLKKFLPSIVQCMDKVKPSSQVYLLEEAIIASWIVISRAETHSDAVSDTVGKIWPGLVNIITYEKILSTSSVSHSILAILLRLAERLLVYTIPGLTLNNSKAWLSAILQTTVTSTWDIHQLGINSLKHVTTSDPEYSLLVIEQLYQLFDKPQIQVGDQLCSDRMNKSIWRVLCVVSNNTFDEEIKKEIARKSFLLCHYPELSALWGGTKGAWLRILQCLSLPFSSLLPFLPDMIDSLMLNTRAHSHVCSSAMSTLVSVAHNDMGVAISEKVVSVLLQESVQTTTVEDLEIAATPPSELWDSQLDQLLGNAMLEKADKNIKRETKAYSYEDQLWEAKVKEELAKKKMVEQVHADINTRLQQAKLTQKQRQSIEDQLKYESTVRERVITLRTQLKALLTLFNSFITCTSATSCLPHIPSMVSAILKGLSSLISGSFCLEMWKGLCVAVVKSRKTALQLCWMTTRLLKPANKTFTIPPYWSSMDLSDTLSDLYSSLPVCSGVQGDVVCALSLPLVRGVVCQGVRDELRDCIGNLLTSISGMCQAHASLDKFGHSLFPVVEMICLLSYVIASDEPSLRTMKAKKLMVDGFMSLVNSLSNVHQLSPPLVNEFIKMISDHDSLLRQTGLRGMDVLGDSILQPPSPQVMTALMVACNDSISENSILANKLWQTGHYSEGDMSLRDPLITLLTNSSNEGYQTLLPSTAIALSKWLNHHHDLATELRDELIKTYASLRKIPPPSVDEFGRTISTEYKDPWIARVGVAKAYAQLPKYMSSDDTMKLVTSIVPFGLSDRNGEVRQGMSDAAQQAITEHGKALSSKLMDHCDGCLSALGSSQSDDLVRKDVVVLMGTLAKHMDKKDPKVKNVVEMLLTNLDTPSQQVQQAISTCLVPLASSIKDNASDVIKKLMNKLLESSVYSERRGAAYGIAGIVKGLGIPSLKQFEIMTQLQEAIKDKKQYRHREGALFAFEALCDILGKLFEPYVVTLLPDLLLCFGDGNQYVREATDQASKTIMAHLSSHGVKLILPSLLTALGQDNWRTKAGSAELLGTMAYCAPKQLSSCLPSIVPRLMEVLTDSHSKVQKAGNQALKEIGSVIKNPEVQKLVPELLDALGNPSSKTQPCLKVLVSTEFEHHIDPPSLALLIPIIQRALDLRSAESKKMAAQVIANVYTVTDKKDLSPYLGEVLPGLKQSITDPLPEVRSACAKALGAMVQGVGEEELSKVLPWLLKTLQSDASPVDRSGAAQGISEVLKTQNIKHLKQLMPRFIDSAQNNNNPAHSRDGFLMLFIYLPQAFEDQFLPFIDQILPPILKGLADESEFIRDTAILSAQTIISIYADKSLDLFLPQLEKGLLDDNWRIRCSSVQLLGDLLFSISGQSGKMTTESAEDDNFASEELYKIIVNALGVERRNRVLAGLYMGRSDVALPVRQNSLHVWKLVVTNTARTLREILPTLISILLTCLACDSYDKRQVAAQTLGDLVRKLGERVLPEIIPMLEKGLRSDSFQEREGVCIGLSEIVKETSKDYMQMYTNSLLPTIRLALCDAAKSVRTAAAQTFDSLYVAVGQRVLEEVLTPLVDKLQSSESDDERLLVLDGLQQIMTVRSNVVLPMIIPHLISPPVNIKALSLLAPVAGHALYKHLPKIIPAVVKCMHQDGGIDSDALTMAIKVVSCVEDEPGVSILFEELFKLGRHDSYRKRHASMLLIEALCSNNSIDYTDHIPQLLMFIVESLVDDNEGVCSTACASLEALISKVIGIKDLPNYINDMHKALRTCKKHLDDNNEAELHGFSLKGIMPVLTMLKEGLVSGSHENKEEGARVLILVIGLSSAKTLTSGRVVMMIAGPLIRVLGDKYRWQVKVAVLEALVALVRKVGSGVKGFIPQLQSSYLKALIDPNHPVRAQSVIGIAELMMLSPRVDPVFNDIHNNIKKNEESSLRNSLLQALSGVLQSAGNKMVNYKVDIKDTLVKLQDTAHEGNRLEAAKSLGILCTCLTDEQLVDVVKDNLTRTSSTMDWGVLQAKALAVLSAMQHNVDRLSSVGLQGDIESAVTNFVSSDRIPVCVMGLQCVTVFVNKFDSSPQPMILAVKECFSNSSIDVRQAVCVCVKDVVSPTDWLLKATVPLLMVAVQDKNTAVRFAAEEAILTLFMDSDKLKHCSTDVLDSASGRRLEECYARLSSKQSKS